MPFHVQSVTRYQVAVALNQAADELARAMDIHPTGMRSAHEGYAVMLEELDELWREIKLRSSLRDPAKMRAEALQVAAMALRFCVDVVPVPALGAGDGQGKADGSTAPR